MSLKLFIAGTDTGVGKTHISTGILSAFNQHGHSTLGIKPIASGCRWIENKLYSEDTLLHQQISSVKLAHDVVTPFAFEPPIAPHIAAEMTDCDLSVEILNERLRFALDYPADVKVVEGCGGWYVPLNHLQTFADFVVEHEFHVVLVVGMRLGCINHALLTYRAMVQDGANVIGWIANCIDPAMKNRNENIATLTEWLPVPCLSVVSHGGHLVINMEEMV